MAKQGYRVMDSDLHVIEPRNLWDDYIDPKFRGRIVTIPDTSDTFLGLPHLSSETKRKVLWDNCARLYNLQPVSAESTGGH